MKKLFNVMIATIAVVSLIFAGAMPVSAQDINVKDVLTKVQEANKELGSQEGDAKLDFSVTIDGTEQIAGDLNGTFQMNVDPKFAAFIDGQGNFRQAVPVTDENGNVTETQNQEIPFSGQITVLDSILYAFDGSAWTVEDISDVEAEVSKVYTDAMAQVTESQAEVTDDLVALYEKYMDITETDSEYVFKMKPDINSEEFWADAQKVVDIEKIKQEAIDDAIAQAEAQGIEMTEEQKAQMKDTYDKAFNMIFDMFDNYEIHYAKDTNKVTKLVMNMTLDNEDLAKLASEAMPAEDSQVNLVFNLEMNFKNHGQNFDIQVPADAPTFDGGQEASDGADANASDTATDQAADSASESTESQE